jgi:hypothetical protein
MSERDCRDLGASHGPTPEKAVTSRERAVDLHEEIVQAMLEKSVDPFERSYRLSHDPLLLDVTMKAPKLLEGTISLKYWRDFSANKKYLESRSAEHPKVITTPVTKKPVSIHKRAKKKKALQDVRQPSSHITHSFAAPPKGFSLFDSHIIGPRNPVQRLVGDLNPQPSDEAAEFASPPALINPTSPKKIQSNLVPFYGDIGTPLPGGAMKLGRARDVQPLPVTVNATLPTTRELDGERAVVGGKFLLAARFPPASPRRRAAPSSDPPLTQSTREPSEKYRGRFSENPRFPPHYTETFTPSPGSYQVPRLFDHIKPRLSSERAEELIREIKEHKGLRCASPPLSSFWIDLFLPLLSETTPVWSSAKRQCLVSAAASRSMSSMACVSTGSVRGEPNGKM